MRRKLTQLPLKKICLLLVVGVLVSAVAYNWYVLAEEKQAENPQRAALDELLTQARQFYYQGKYKQSINYYQRAAAAGKKVKAFSNLAVIYEERGAYQHAKQKYQQLVGLTEQPKFSLGLGISYYNLNELKAARRTLSNLLEADGRAYKDHILRDAYHYLGLIAYQQNHYQRAEQYFQRAIKQQTFALGYYQLGEIYFARGQYQQAKDYYQRALQIDGSLRGVNYKLGLSALRLSQPAQAVNYLQRAKRSNSRLEAVEKKLAELKQQYPRYFAPEKRPHRGLPPDKVIPEQTDFRSIQPLSTPGPQLRVGLMENKPEVNLRTGSDFLIKQEGKIIAQGQQGQLITAATGQNQAELTIGDQTLTFTEPITIVPKRYAPIALYNVGYGAGYYWAGKHHSQYRGQLELRPSETGFTVVNLVHLEEYLLAVVPSEMSASWPIAALKVQSVAARSYTLANLGRHSKSGYDLCSSVHCAAYRGISQEADRVKTAIQATLGEVMIYNGYPINAVYSANSGGHTADSENVWAAKVPYLRGVSTEIHKSNFPLSPVELKGWLKGVPASYSRGSDYTKLSHYRWQRSLSTDYLEASLEVANIEQILPAKRGETGWVESIVVIGENERKKFSSALRSQLGGLRSGRFWVQPKYRRGKLVSFLFYGSGWGHAVGMDQVAVASMAQAGKKYTTILHHFYTGVKIKDWY